METIKERYERIRPEVTDGCLFLMSKDKFVSKAIRWFDKSEFSHIGIIFEKYGRLFILDSNMAGVHPELLSARVNLADNFIFIKPMLSKTLTTQAMEAVFKRSELNIEYDFINGAKELSNRKFGSSFKIISSEKNDICSKLTRQPAITQSMVTKNFELIPQPLPQDYLRYRNIYNTTLL